MRLEARCNDPDDMSARREREGMSYQLRRRAKQATIKEHLSLQWHRVHDEKARAREGGG